jgi:hypothetical protein
LATKLNGLLIYLFTKEINFELKNELKNNLKIAKNAITEIWVYKKLGPPHGGTRRRRDELILINSDQPTFPSKHKASKELGISDKKISKIIDTYESYKEYVFYSEKLN